ncbi:hypothetical protein [Porphyromonas canoris]|nr:hypothetical protein [Porphyromonas canoris]
MDKATLSNRNDIATGKSYLPMAMFAIFTFSLCLEEKSVCSS